MNRFVSLSDREAQVLALAAEGLLDKEIGCRLGVSVNTLRTYWRRIRAKTGNLTRTGLVAAWIDSTNEPGPMPAAWNPFRRWEIDFEDAKAFSVEVAIDIANGSDQRTTGIRSILPEDFPQLAKALQELVDGADSGNAQYRIVFQGRVYCSSTVWTVWRDETRLVRKLVGYSIDTLDTSDMSERESPGIWIGGLHADTFHANPEMCRIFGLDPEKDSSTALRFRERVNPEDYANLRRLADAADAMGGGFITCNMRVLVPGKPERLMRVQALVDREPHGIPLIIGQYEPGLLGKSSVKKL